MDGTDWAAMMGVERVIIKFVMAALNPELEQYKERIPEFIVKLYYMLEQSEFTDYLAWHADSEILIKSPKKLEEKVLPHFFRHRHLSSFIRQLNMYKFSKVVKIKKQKNYMYFKNEHFKRGHIKELLKIKRFCKKNKIQKSSQAEEEERSSDQQSANISLAEVLEKSNQPLREYKDYVKSSVKEIVEILKKIEGSVSESRGEVLSAMNICHELLEGRATSSLSLSLQEQNQNKNMLSTIQVLPRLDSLAFPSNGSLYHLNSSSNNG